MAELICVTQRSLCSDDFLERIRHLAQAKPQAILLREKDLGEADYEVLAREVQERCAPWGVRLIVRRYADVARRLGVQQLHLSMEELRQAEPEALAGLQTGISVHSVPEALEAQQLGGLILLRDISTRPIVKKIWRRAAWTFCAKCVNRSAYLYLPLAA